MSPLSFDGRVAVVTGAGRGIGRAYALMLAERGASVVVNDLGSSTEGDGADAGPAAGVVAEIAAAGGAAVADASDVADAAGATTVIDAALDNFGRIDVLVHNAGIVRFGGLPDVDTDDLQRHLAVHVFGSFHTVAAAWPPMVAQGYGRIVLTTSTGMLGRRDNTAYATAKAAVVGLMRSAKLAGDRHGIKVNCIAPAAFTRMAGQTEDGSHGRISEVMSPELVAPMAAFLAHEECPVSGEIYTAGAGRFARLFIASTEGYVHPGGRPVVEDVAEHWDAINDESGYFVPADLMAWSQVFLAHLEQDRRER